MLYLAVVQSFLVLTNSKWGKAESVYSFSVNGSLRVFGFAITISAVMNTLMLVFYTNAYESPLTVYLGLEFAMF